MPSESKPLLTAQTEKPNHYSYLKEFRVEQCPLFLQHKCTQHRPFTCFHWHFMNQRRRRPVRRRDGTFNYSADNYCTKYDETTGICPDGDECPFLHRTAGDTERRYHLRYYKTCMCVHDTDSRGYCVKNGLHCAFAHGSHDHRPPVYDIKEIQALEAQEICDAVAAHSAGAQNAPNALDKERNLMNEDPKWQDTNFVLSNYKTEACKRPPRLCRQGYACPQYHNSKDKRRSPRKFKYRSTPCPNVKHGEEWGEPANCDVGDMCSYCHTRTEQQFHPEIYKSTKCNDVQQSGYCPRGVFCAFAHVEQEMGVQRDASGNDCCGTNLSEILSNVLPVASNATNPMDKTKEKMSDSSNGSSEVSESASTSSLGSNSSHSKAPGSQLSAQAPKQSLFNNQRMDKMYYSYNNYFGTNSTTVDPVDSVFLDDLMLEDSLEEGLLVEGGTAPVNIPNTSGFLSQRFSAQHQQQLQQQEVDFLTQQLSSSASKLQNYPSFFDLSPSSVSRTNAFSMSPSLNNGGGLLEVQRLKEELQSCRLQLNNWEERLLQARTACDAWQRETEEANRKTQQAEQQLKESIEKYNNLRLDYEQLSGGPHIRSLSKVSELSKLSLTVLKTLHAQLRGDLEEIEKVLYRETAAKCMVCEERNRTVTLNCNHFVLCDACAATQTECPYCQTPNQLII